jgi:hypothetical protein
MVTRKIFIEDDEEDLTPTSGNSWFLMVLVTKLQDILESSVPDIEDSEIVKIHNWKWKVILKCGSPFQGTILSVQTAGTITEALGADSSNKTIHQILADKISDEVGYNIIVRPKASRLSEAHYNGTGVDYNYVWEHTFELPNRLKRFLEKTSNSERHQDNYLVFLGKAMQNSTDNVKMYTLTSLEYSEVSKPIIYTR